MLQYYTLSYTTFHEQKRKINDTDIILLKLLTKY